ncbi:MAG: hypothetical protein AAGJ35_05350 [Myxococcota bacterium]
MKKKEGGKSKRTPSLKERLLDGVDVENNPYIQRLSAFEDSSYTDEDAALLIQFGGTRWEEETHVMDVKLKMGEMILKGQQEKLEKKLINTRKQSLK